MRILAAVVVHFLVLDLNQEFFQKKRDRSNIKVYLGKNLLKPILLNPQELNCDDDTVFLQMHKLVSFSFYLFWS